MSEIMRGAGINLASCHAVLNAMTGRGYLVRNGKSYALGGATIAVGHAASQTHGLVALAQAAARELNRKLGVAVLLSILAGSDLLALLSLPGSAGRPIGLRAGQRVPLVPPTGVRFLAWADEEAVEAWIARADKADDATIAGWRRSLALTHERGFQVTLRAGQTSAFAELMRTMAAGNQPLAYRTEASGIIADHGWTLEQPETIDAGAPYDVGLIAAPIFDRQGKATLSLGLGAFAEPLSGARITLLAEHLMAACLRVTREHRESERGPTTQ